MYITTFGIVFFHIFFMYQYHFRSVKLNFNESAPRSKITKIGLIS